MLLINDFAEQYFYGIIICAQVVKIIDNFAAGATVGKECLDIRKA